MSSLGLSTFALRSLGWFSVIAFCGVQLCAQTRGGITLSGELVREGSTLPHNLAVELVNPLNHELVGREQVSGDGTFQIRGVPAGQYEARVVDPYGESVAHEMVTVGNHEGALVLRLPGQPGSTPGGPPVSLSRLQHRVPRSAAREFERSEKVLRKGDLEASRKHLERAVAIDPDFSEAQNNLGARYAAAGEYQRAAQAFAEARRADPASAMAITNLGLMYVHLGRNEEAEAAARAALRLNPQSTRAYYLLGLALGNLDRKPAEALSSLEKAAPEFPRALLASARIHARMGNRALAAEALRQYLADPHVRDRAVVENLLAGLR